MIPLYFRAQEKRQASRISFVDLRKAHFDDLPEHEIYTQIPKQLGLPPNTVANQVRYVYGTGDAGKLWKDRSTMVLEAMAFLTGVSKPCIFYSVKREVMVVVHGADFTKLGLDRDIDWFEDKLHESFEIKIRGRLGEGCNSPRDLRILERVVSVDESGLSYEADPRHCDLFIKSLAVDDNTHAANPGVTRTDRDDVAEQSYEPESLQLNDYSDTDAAIAAICLGTPDACNANAGSTYSHARQPQENLISRVENKVCALLLHSSRNRELETHARLHMGLQIGALSTIRLTCCVYSTGRRFTHFDSWTSEKSAHAPLRKT